MYEEETEIGILRSVVRLRASAERSGQRGRGGPQGGGGRHAEGREPRAQAELLDGRADRPRGPPLRLAAADLSSGFRTHSKCDH